MYNIYIYTSLIKCENALIIEYLLYLPYDFLWTFTLQFTFFNTNRLQGTFVKVGFYLSSRDRAE